MKKHIKSLEFSAFVLFILITSGIILGSVGALDRAADTFKTSIETTK